MQIVGPLTLALNDMSAMTDILMGRMAGQLSSDRNRRVLQTFWLMCCGDDSGRSAILEPLFMTRRKKRGCGEHLAVPFIRAAPDPEALPTNPSQQGLIWFIHTRGRTAKLNIQFGGLVMNSG